MAAAGAAAGGRSTHRRCRSARSPATRARAATTPGPASRRRRAGQLAGQAPGRSCCRRRTGPAACCPARSPRCRAGSPARPVRARRTTHGGYRRPATAGIRHGRPGRPNGGPTGPVQPNGGPNGAPNGANPYWPGPDNAPQGQHGERPARSANGDPNATGARSTRGCRRGTTGRDRPAQRRRRCGQRQRCCRAGSTPPRAEAAVRELLIAVGEDPDRDGLLNTPGRVARAFAEQFAGLYIDPGRCWTPRSTRTTPR